MLDFLRWFPEPFGLVVAIGIMFSVVPITGLLCFGNVRQAWAYTKDWLRVVGGMVVVAAVLAWLFWLILTPPP
jgi:hypothetical protein